MVLLQVEKEFLLCTFLMLVSDNNYNHSNILIAMF